MNNPEPDVDIMQLVRPGEFETDYDWACDLTDRIFLLQNDLDEAEAALDRIEQAIDEWKGYLKDVKEASQND